MSDTSNRLAGTAYVTVDGITVMVAGSFKYSPSRVKRETVMGMDGVHGYKETSMRLILCARSVTAAGSPLVILMIRPMSILSANWRMAKPLSAVRCGR